MAYLVKEIFGPTIQGEGAHAGRACVFLRFAACNLSCSWCDTDFAREGAPQMTAEEIATQLQKLDRNGSRMVVVTGGEPTLQWDHRLATAVRDAGFAVHMETNGTRVPEAQVDWLTVSPKPHFHTPVDALVGGRELRASECKLVVDDAVDDEALDRYVEHYRCKNYFLQPCMDERYEHHLTRTLELIQRHPGWRLSVQLHKIVGLP
jgi:organic radical activating enzyme